jgi:hypothetical protein
MEINDLIRLAAKADLEGNFRVADRITVKIENILKEAAKIDFRRLGPATNELLKGLIGNAQSAKSSTHTKRIRGNWYTPEDAQKIVDSHNTEKAAKAALKTNPAGQNITGGGANAQAQVVNGVLPGSQNITGPGPNAQAQVVQYLNPPTPGKTGRKGRDGKDGAQGIQGIQGIQGDPGPQGPAGKWWPGVVAGLLSGAIGAGGVALWLRERGCPEDYIRVIENRLDNHFKSNQLAARTQAGLMGNQQAAQNFIEARRGNPKFNTAQDFYYEAQRLGLPESMMNSIAALAKSEGYQDLTRFQD